MKRGYLIHKKGSKIMRGEYIGSDAQLCSFGIRILNSLKADTTIDLLDLLKEAYSEDTFSKNDISFYKENPDYYRCAVDYTYEWNEKTSTITIYNRTIKAGTVTKENLEAMLYLFENYETIILGLNYDNRNRCFLSKDKRKSLNVAMKLAGEGISALEYMSAKANAIGWYLSMDDNEIWSDEGTQNTCEWHCKKRTGESITFVVEKTSKNVPIYSISIQLPFTSCRIVTKLKTEKAVKKALKDYIIKNEGKLDSFVQACEIYRESCEKINDIKKSKMSLDEKVSRCNQVKRNASSAFTDIWLNRPWLNPNNLMGADFREGIHLHDMYYNLAYEQYMRIETEKQQRVR